LKKEKENGRQNITEKKMLQRSEGEFFEIHAGPGRKKKDSRAPPTEGCLGRKEKKKLETWVGRGVEREGKGDGTPPHVRKKEGE